MFRGAGRQVLTALWAALAIGGLQVLGQAQEVAPVGAKPAAKPSPEELRRLRDAKMALPVFKLAPWSFDYDAARVEAKASGKLVFAYFTRSYAPAMPATQLEQGVFSSPAFGVFARQVVLFCHVSATGTGVLEGDKYPELLREKGGRAFPFLVILDADGRVVATHPGIRNADRTVASFEALLRDCQASLELERRFRAGENAVGLDLLAAKAAIRGITLAEARSLVAELRDLSEPQRLKVEATVVEIEVDEHYATVHLKTEAVAVGKHFASMWEQRRIPTGTVAVRNFYALILEAKEAERDAKGFAAALAAYRKLVDGSNPRVQSILDGYQTRLEALEKIGKNDQTDKKQ